MIRTLFLACSILFGAGCTAPSASPIQGPVPYRGPFGLFALNLKGIKPTAQIDLAERIGFQGLGLSWLDRASVHEVAGHPDVVSGKFRIFSALWWENPESRIDSSDLEAILDDAHRMDMAVWMVIGGAGRTDLQKSNAVERLARMARRCRAKGVRLVLYPHLGTAFETAEDAMAMYDSLKRRGYPETRLSIHLCHELKAGNRDRLEGIVAKVAPLLDLATISGAQTDAHERGSKGWEDAILPLDEGSYDSRHFLRALVRAGYTGPIELHTYGLRNPDSTGYDRNLERSFSKWKEMTGEDSIRSPGTSR